jgi:hypothetical protein
MEPFGCDPRPVAVNVLLRNSRGIKQRPILVISYPHSSSRLSPGRRIRPALVACESSRASGRSNPRTAAALLVASSTFHACPQETRPVITARN